eukprot:9634326-Karenia_brevis.AAC.1
MVRHMLEVASSCHRLTMPVLYVYRSSQQPAASRDRKAGTDSQELAASSREQPATSSQQPITQPIAS